MKVNDRISTSIVSMQDKVASKTVTLRRHGVRGRKERQNSQNMDPEVEEE